MVEAQAAAKLNKGVKIMERVIRRIGNHGTSIEIDVSDEHSIVGLRITNMLGNSAAMSMSRQDLEQLATQINERLHNLAR